MATTWSEAHQARVADQGFSVLLWPKHKQKVTLPLVEDLVHLLLLCSNDVKSLKRHFSAANALRLLKQAATVLDECPNVVRLEIPSNADITVIGDTHGQMHDVLKIFSENGNPSPTNWYVFNGDFVDRGNWGVELALVIFAFKVVYPDYVHLLRGNHETAYCTGVYGFETECMGKYNRNVFMGFKQAFRRLPVAGVLRRATFGVFVAHGGLFRKPDGVLGKVADLDGLKRKYIEPDDNTMLDLLWSDPSSEPGMCDNAMRGIGSFYGPEITEMFLEQNDLSLVVRSHEGPDAREKRPHMSNMMEGYAFDHVNEGQPRLVTLFSAPNYPQGPLSRGNKAAYMRFAKGDDMVCEIRQFTQADRPDILIFYTQDTDVITDHEDNNPPVNT